MNAILNDNTALFWVTVIAVLIITAAAECFLIKLLRARRVGQYIREEGPEWHRSKAGTPIMGGLGFVLASLVVLAVFFVAKLIRGESARYVGLALTISYAVLNAGIGFVDDYAKVIKKENEGLTAKQKLLLQVVVAAAYLCMMSFTDNLVTALRVPFTTLSIELGWVYYPIALLVLVGIVNGSNFTDGVDGLLGSVTLVIGVFFAFLAYESMSDEMTVCSAILIGACFGFLLFNFHPAKIFMGDTGSLFLGALVIGVSVLWGDLTMGILLSGVYIIEMLSSFLQVVVFKLTHGKRLFRMAPLHHHFEKCGWNEYTVVGVFSLVEGLFCTLAWNAMLL